MTDNRYSIDSGETWVDIDLDVTGLIAGSSGVDGFNFVASDADLGPYVDSGQLFVFEVPSVCDDPLIGILQRQGSDYVLRVTER